MSMDVRPIEDHPTGFKDNVVRCLRKYVDGNGRARRREYWWFALLQILVVTAPTVVALMVGALIGGGDEDSPFLAGLGLFFIVAGFLYLGLVIPSITVLIRRFHDVGLSGWLILLGIVPLVGSIFTFVVSVLPSQPHPNKHGLVPGRAQQTAADVFT